MDKDEFSAIEWSGGRLRLLDQRLLPATESWLEIDDVDGAIEAIRELVVRGAPAIGITAAYAAVLAARDRGDDRAGWQADLERLVAARPTAVNLHWAVARIRPLVQDSPAEAAGRLETEARAIHAEDIAANRAMASAGAGLIEPGSGVLTHCNTGALATGGIGTAFGVIVRAWRDGRLSAVYADETRPWFQGSRLTAWELARAGVPGKVIVEGAAAGLLQSGRIQWVITGADRIAANGDVANKVGTLMLGVLARQFGARLMVVAPTSTVDLNMPDGAGIEIEQRSADEIWRPAGLDQPPAGIGAWNPVFDVTPSEFVSAIVTERGVCEPPFRESLAGLRED